MRRLISLFALAVACDAQWIIRRSSTDADLRGIDSLGHGLAWASGTDGTILRTRDAGETWERCAGPPGAEHLDFRGIQGVSADNAIAMSAGPGDLSRVYETRDGCRTWELLITNPDRAGFWNAILYDQARRKTFVFGDPVGGNFVLYSRENTVWRRDSIPGSEGQAAFAASNSVLIEYRRGLCIVTGGARAEFICDRFRRQLPFASGESSGAFSVGAHLRNVVVVGGNYRQPADRAATAAFSLDSGRTFTAAKTMPNGYRSTVAYDGQHGIWVAAGPNGTDISEDNGVNWLPAQPRNRNRLSSDSDKDWNALSPPFAVGPHGHIGRMDFKP